MTKLKMKTPFSVDVGSRIARASYGAVCEELFDGNVHQATEKVFNPKLQKDVVPRVMKWHVVAVRSAEIPIKIDYV